MRRPGSNRSKPRATAAALREWLLASITRTTGDPNHLAICAVDPSSLVPSTPSKHPMTPSTSARSASAAWWATVSSTCRRFGISRETVRSATSIPSFRSSPWIRGAPQRGFAVAMRVIRVLISAWTAGRPPVERPESLLQYSRKRRRCHRRTVSAVTITRGCLHPTQTLASQIQKRRSVVRSLGLGRRSFGHSQLLPQGKVLDSELAVAAEEEREQSKHVEQEGDHRAEILSGSAPTDQRLAAGRGFGEG